MLAILIIIISNKYLLGSIMNLIKERGSIEISTKP